MAAAADILEALRRTRPGYDEEGIWVRFLLDAFAGSGGFQGKVRQPEAGYYGSAAEVYSSNPLRDPNALDSCDTYLDRFPREDDPSFTSRKDVAHYPNYVGPLTSLKVSYVLGKEFTKENVPEKVEDWHDDVDGRATTFDEMRAKIVLDAAKVGVVPVLIDMDPVPPGVPAEISVAQAKDAGIGRPRMIPLCIGNILEWSVVENELLWVKIRTDHVEHTSWIEKPITVRRYAIWTRTDVTVFRVIEEEGKDATVEAPVTTPHPFGRVPLTFCRHAPAEDGVRGEPMHGQVSVEARRLFNLLSELDLHLRGNVFAILVMSGPGPSKGEITVGTQGLPLAEDAKHPHYYLAPDASIASTYETRIENTIKELYRQARVEFSRPTAAAVSGVSRAYEFAQTDHALGDFAKNVAEWEEDVDDLVGIAFGVEEAVRLEERVQPPTSFDIEDVNAEIDNAIKVTTLKVGPTATKLLRLRVIQRVLKRLSQQDRDAIEAEIAKLSTDEQKAADAAREQLANAPPPDPNAPPPKPGESDPNAKPDPKEDPAKTPPAKRAA